MERVWKEIFETTQKERIIAVRGEHLRKRKGGGRAEKTEEGGSKGSYYEGEHKREECRRRGPVGTKLTKCRKGRVKKSLRRGKAEASPLPRAAMGGGKKEDAEASVTKQNTRQRKGVQLKRRENERGEHPRG